VIRIYPGKTVLVDNIEKRVVGRDSCPPGMLRIKSNNVPAPIPRSNEAAIIFCHHGFSGNFDV
jgi:hypothetical protein